MTCKEICIKSKMGENPTIEDLNSLKGFKTMVPAVEAVINAMAMMDQAITPVEAIEIAGDKVKDQFIKSAMGSVRAASAVRLSQLLENQKHVLREIAKELNDVEANRLSVAFTRNLDGRITVTAFEPKTVKLAKEKQDSHNGNAQSKNQAKTYLEVNNSLK